MSPQTTNPVRMPIRLPPAVLASALVLLILIAYLPALPGQFLWDDDSNVTKNEPLRSLAGLRRIWFEPGATQQFYPLTHSTFWLDYHLWGLHTLPYHLENILLHSFSTILLWLILKRLKVRGAWLGAALFGLHPVCAESVAWITERKNALAGVFFLGSILCSLRFWLPELDSSEQPPDARPLSRPENSGPRRFYWLALALYFCALLSKTSTVALPGIIGLLVWWKRGWPRWREALPLGPFLAVGFGMGLITMWVEKHCVSAVGPEWNFTPVERILISARMLWFYTGKLLWPHPVMFMYPKWSIHAADPIAWLPIAAGIAILLLLWWKRNSWGRPFLVTAGYAILAVFPMLAFFNQYFFRYSFVCDHFPYLANMGAMGFVGALLCAAAEKLATRQRWLLPASSALLLPLLGALTWKQAEMYRAAETLWRVTLAHNPDSWMAHNNLCMELTRQERMDEAMDESRKALALHPSDFAYNNLGLSEQARGHLDAAVDLFQKALEINPSYGPGHYNLANVLAQKGMLDEAIDHYRKAIQLRSAVAAPRMRLGAVLARKGMLDDALAELTEAVRLDPTLAEGHYELGMVLARKDRLDDATQELTKAAQLKPGTFRPALAALSNSLLQRGNRIAAGGDLDGAAVWFRKALQANPDNPTAHHNLGSVLARQNKRDEAFQEYSRALELRPEDAEALQA